jgi:hypothetical protein
VINEDERQPRSLGSSDFGPECSVGLARFQGITAEDEEHRLSLTKVDRRGRTLRDPMNLGTPHPLQKQAMPTDSRVNVLQRS